MNKTREALEAILAVEPGAHEAPRMRAIARAALRLLDEAKPVAWRYRYIWHDGSPVWVLGNAGPWNGQQPFEADPLYTHAAPPAPDAEDAARWRKMRELWFHFGVMHNLNTPLGRAIHAIQVAGDAETLDAAVDAARGSEHGR